MKPNHLLYLLLPTFLAVLPITSQAGAKISGCDILPADNVWNTPIDTLPVHPYSSAWITSVGAGTSLHMDFAAGKWEGKEIGIPFNIINASKEPKQTFNFLYNDESDPGPYPINSTFKIEEGGDHHLINLDQETCTLYETFNTVNLNGWKADSGAVWDLKSNAFRPIGWTSADAAGLPILPGLVRYEEVEAGVINHAIRFTMEATNSYIWPGSHLTSGVPGLLTNKPPMGARFRLKADYDISKFDPKMQVILKAMKTYGIINADNGGNWFFSGVPDPRWNDEQLSSLKVIKGSAFEVVDESCLMISPDSGKADPSKCALIAKERPTGSTSTAVPNIAGCNMLPADNVWNTPIDELPVHPKSIPWVANIGAGTNIHMDFGSEQWEGKDIGIPYNIVSGKTDPKYTFNFLYNDESDVGPYVIGANSKIEQGDDHHLLTLDKDTCKLYEIFQASNVNGWKGDSGAIWDLNSNALRPIGWTSADAAGLPITPGLVRYEEVAAGVINHALRFTAGQTYSYLWPGTHLTDGAPGKLNDFKPPLGARFRLKAGFVISGYDPQLQVILKAMKTYGMILADNGGPWFVSGVPDSRWNDEFLSLLKRIKGAQFEVVDESCLMVSPDSAKADLGKCGVIAKERIPTPTPTSTPVVTTTPKVTPSPVVTSTPIVTPVVTKIPTVTPVITTTPTVTTKPVASSTPVVTPPTTSSCSYTIDSPSKNFNAEGGIDKVIVYPASTNASSCTWTVVKDPTIPWIPVYIQKEGNTNRVIYAVSRNKSNTPRTATINVAGKSFTVTQSK